jgi:hypothetical protein
MNLLDVNYDQQEIVGAVKHHMGNGRYPKDITYGNGHAGKKIAQVLGEAPLRIDKRLTY